MEPREVGAGRSIPSNEPRMRELILSLPEPWSLNNLIRMSYHMRNQRREMLKKRIDEQMREQFGSEWKASWQFMKYVEVDAIFNLSAKRDRFELPAALKIEMDALQEIGVITSDGPQNLRPGVLRQNTGGARGVRIRLRELPRPIVEPELEF